MDRPSIASILTGLHPGVHGVQGREGALTEPSRVLAELFAEHGYATGAIVTNPNVGSFYGFSQGFSTYVELYERRERGLIASQESVVPSNEVNQRAIQWIEQADRPFFLFILTIDPHWPYAPPTEFDPYRGDGLGADVPDWLGFTLQDLGDGDRQRTRRLYDAEVEFNDRSLGELLDHLREAKLYDKTITVFTSDHGEEFWEHGLFGHGSGVFEEVLRVPLIVHYPPAVPVAAEVREPATLVDIAPTLLELAEIPAPASLDGTSLRQLEASGERPLHAQVQLDGNHVTSITRHPWKLIWNQRTRTKRLFNLEMDPEESWELIRKHPEIAGALSEELEEAREAHASRRQRLQGAEEARDVPAASLPEEARDALEALGYLEPEADGASDGD